MAQRGPRVGDPAPADTPGAGELGRILGSLSIAPRRAFEDALKSARVRARTGNPVPGRHAYVLSAAAGAAFFLLSLKVTSLVGLRDSCTFSWAYLALAAVTGAVLGLAAVGLWGPLGGALARAGRARADGAQARLVWGLASGPQVLALVILLPLDLVLVGPEAYLTVALEGTAETAWAGLSIALGISLSVWSLFLLFRGLEVLGLPTPKALSATFAASALFAVVVGSLVIAGAISGETSCPSLRT